MCKVARFSYNCAYVDGKFRVLVSDSKHPDDEPQFLKPPGSYTYDVHKAASVAAVLRTVPQNDELGLLWPTESVAIKAAAAATKAAKKVEKRK